MKRQRRTSNATRVRPSDKTGTVTRLMGVSELAAILNVDERHIYRLVAERRIPYIKWGHLLRFDADEVQRWLDANRVEAPTAQPTMTLAQRAAPHGRRGPPLHPCGLRPLGRLGILHRPRRTGEGTSSTSTCCTSTSGAHAERRQSGCTGLES
jgi:excisionase family DNA binding protein